MRSLGHTVLCLLTVAAGIMSNAWPIVPAQASSSLPYLQLDRPERGRVFALAWSPDGQDVAVGTELGLWLYTSTLQDVAYIADRPIHALAWSPDGQWIAAGYFGDLTLSNAAQGGGLRLWSAKKTGGGFQLVLNNTLLRDGSVFVLRFSPDGSTLACLSEDGIENGEETVGKDSLRLYTMPSGKLFQSFTAGPTFLPQKPGVTQGANGLAWSADGRYLAVMGQYEARQTSDFSILDTHTRQFVALTDDWSSQEGIVGNITAVDWQGNNRIAYSGVQNVDPNTQGVIGVCALTTLAEGCQLSAPPTIRADNWIEDIPVLAWRPGSMWLAYGDESAIRLWDAATQRSVATLDAALDSVTMLNWSPDGSKLLSAGADGLVRLWTRFQSYQTGDPIPRREIALPTGNADNHVVVVSPDGRWIADADALAKQVKVFDVFSGALKTVFTPPVDNPFWAAFYWSPDSTLLALPIFTSVGGCAGPNIRDVEVWSAQSGEIRYRVSGAAGVAFRADNQALAVGQMTEKGLVFEARDGQTGKVNSTSLPNERWSSTYVFMKTSGYMWDAHEPTASLWSPDGRLVALDDYIDCGDYDWGTVLLWDSVSGALLAQLPAPRSSVGGSGGNADALAWSPDGSFILIQGMQDTFLYHLRWEAGRVIPELVWQRSLNNALDHVMNGGNTLFSRDGHYFLYGGDVWDTTKLRPVFRFRNLADYTEYRWIGDTILAFNLTERKALVFSTSDFLVGD